MISEQRWFCHAQVLAAMVDVLQHETDGHDRTCLLNALEKTTRWAMNGDRNWIRKARDHAMLASCDNRNLQPVVHALQDVIGDLP